MHSLRRTKAILIYRRTRTSEPYNFDRTFENRMYSSHPGIGLDSAIEIAEKIDTDR
jgi:hypothetical protein